MIFITEYKTEFGTLVLGEFEGKLCSCDWKNRRMFEQIRSRIKLYTKTSFVEQKTDFLENVIFQLAQYFKRERTIFDIPLYFAGTDFQQQIWNELINIPYGKTMSYLEMSKKLNNEHAVRAVANANGANAISIIVPCHRIIGSDGSLVGYAGGLQAKKKLLELEQVFLQPELF